MHWVVHGSTAPPHHNTPSPEQPALCSMPVHLQHMLACLCSVSHVDLLRNLDQVVVTLRRQIGNSCAGTFSTLLPSGWLILACLRILIRTLWFHMGTCGFPLIGLSRAGAMRTSEHQRIQKIQTFS